ncbi:hypothetical protein NYO99_18415 [Pelomonas sp. UHG3]|uniref:Uncharacterized protein n=2 Tax=Roseateles hydrophilus TaxID=2975054 RepID=A0ACC6CF48_9BURK|nr:hypothetical protein [Pelomonas sp. UHG3]
MTRRRLRYGERLIPLPFLLVAAMFAAAFWQNHADFVFGRARVVDAVLVDAGLVSPPRGRPRYLPTFRLADGERLTLTSEMVATELPPINAPVQLLCSTRVATNCRTPRSESPVVFYSFALIWSTLSVGVAWLLWGPLFRRAAASRSA